MLCSGGLVGGNSKQSRQKIMKSSGQQTKIFMAGSQTLNGMGSYCSGSQVI